MQSGVAGWGRGDDGAGQREDDVMPSEMRADYRGHVKRKACGGRE